MANGPQTAITLVVSDLDAATSFYLSALGPLGYQIISKAQHQTDYASSVAVGIGPVNTTRVDLFLSASKSANGSHRHRKSPHVVFPAPSRNAVRGFYEAGLQAGGRSLLQPDNKGGVPGLFAAIIQDIDGNKVEVCFSESSQDGASSPDFTQPTTVASAPDRLIHDRRGQASEIHSYRDGHSHSLLREAMTAGSKEDRRSRRSSFSSEKEHSSSKSTTGDNNTTGKAVVGTLLGAAAGLGVVYAFAKESNDSREKEAKFNSRTDERDRMIEQARQRKFATAWREKTAKSRRERGATMERDSGYYSGGSQRRDPSPDVLRREPSYPRPRRRSSFGDRYPIPDRDRAREIERERERERGSVVSSTRTRRAPDQYYDFPQRTRSRREGPRSHVSVSEPQSEARPTPPNGARYIESRSAPKQVPYHTVTVRSPHREREREPAPSGSTRTFRYIPVSSSGKREPAPPSHHGFPDVPGAVEDDDIEVFDPDSDDGLDDETVVPDDSISVAPSDGPSHKVERRVSPRERERRSARRDVAAH